MPRLLNPRHEAFAAIVAAGNPPDLAATVVGYPSKDVGAALALMPMIAARIDERRTKGPLPHADP